MPDFTIKTRSHPDDIAIITIEGRFNDTNGSPLVFEETVKKLYDAGLYHFVFDLSKLTMISSMGIGAFIQTMATCKENHGGIVIVQLQIGVAEVMKMFGLFVFIPMADDIDSAVKILLWGKNH